MKNYFIEKSLQIWFLFVYVLMHIVKTVDVKSVYFKPEAQGSWGHSTQYIDLCDQVNIYNYD